MASDSTDHVDLVTPRLTRQVYWLSLMLFAAAVVVIVSAIEKRWYSGKFLGLKRQHITMLDGTLLFWSIAMRTLLLIAPAWAIAAVLLARNKCRTATVALVVGVGGVLVLLAIDLRLMKIGGGHVADYLENALNPEAWQWGSDLGGVYRHFAKDLLILVVLVAVVLIISRLIARWLTRRRPTWPSGRQLAAVHVGAVLLVIALFPAVRLVDNPLLLERLYDELPFTLGLLRPDIVPGHGTSAFSVNSDAQFAHLGLRAYDVAHTLRPLDQQVARGEGDQPNVVLIIVESFRYQSITPELMPKLAAWAQTGTVLQRHYSASNRSQYGSFALLYGRSPLAYDVTMRANQPAQATELMRRWGYRCSLIASCIFKMANMERMFSDRNFDSITIHGDEKTRWWLRDQQTLADAGALLAGKPDQPHFAVLYLMSTHFRYDYPPQYERYHTDMPFQPDESDRGQSRYSLERDDLLNRYHNALLYLDDVVSQFVTSLDPNRNIVILTGDHGESFYEDGQLWHGSQLSDIQSRTPMVLVGPGIPAQAVSHCTSHVDLLPTLVDVLGAGDARLARCDGTSVLGEKHPRQVLLINKRPFETWIDMVLVAEHDRLMFSLHHKSPRMRVIGFADMNDRVDTALAHPPEDIEHWNTATLGLFNQ